MSSAATAAQKSMEYTAQDLAEVIDYYNGNPLEPRVFPAHQRKLLDTVSQLAFPSAGGDLAKMAGRLVRMTDPDKISFACRAYLAGARERNEETDPGLLFAFLNRYFEHVTPDFIAQRAQAEQEKAEALAAKADEAAAREAEKEEKGSLSLHFPPPLSLSLGLSLTHAHSFENRIKRKREEIS